MLSDTRTRRVLYPITAAVVLAYFLFFTWKSVWMYFDPDDMMNIYKAWSLPLGEILKANVFFWSDSFRPLGALFYRAFYDLAGFNPVPFRVACLAISILNLGLCFWFTRLVTGSGRVGALTVLLFAFHARLIEVWFRTAVVYDLIGFSFFYLAACLYIQTRTEGNRLSATRSVAVALCFICALNSKEHVVVLPVVLLAYEILFQPLRLKNLLFPIALGLLDIPYILGKTFGPGAMTNNPAYRPEYSFPRFAHSWSIFLNYLFLQEDRITPTVAILILAGMLCIAAALRSKHLLLAWTVLFTATAPVAFLIYRGGFVLYVSFVGWCMFAAILLVKLEDLTTKRLPQYRTAIACVVFILVGWRIGKVNLHDRRTDPKPWLYDPPKTVKAMADQMRQLQPSLPAGARTLFLQDAFSNEEWTPYFIMKLLYRDDSMVVDRIKMMDRTPADWNDYFYVFTWENGTYRRLKPNPASLVK